MKQTPLSWLQPQTITTEAELRRGLHMVMLDGIYTQALVTLTGGAFLVAFALLLGASNLVIGLISAVSALTQTLQIPTIYVVEATRRRKAFTVLALSIGRIAWLAVALLPWIMPESYRMPVFLAALFISSALSTVGGLAWQSWMRDFIPQDILGSYMGRRMARATLIGAVLSLAAGFGVDLYKQILPEIGIYSIYFVLGTVAGLLSVRFLAHTPEPLMERRLHPNFLKPIIEPFQDMNFRRLLFFLGSWNFAVNLAAPFFTVYMLKRLDLNMSAIIAFSVLSQAINVLFFRVWGHLADRFSNKSVLTQAGLMFITTFVLWPFTDLLHHPTWALLLLVLIHALAGMSTAGVTLCTGNIALKLAPHGKATGYLAVRSLISGAAATVAPILGGILANRFEGERVTLTLSWISAALNKTWEVTTVNLRGLDFLFILAFLFGLYALHRLLVVHEEGEAEKDVVMTEFNGELRRMVRDVSNVAGLFDLLYMPYTQLLRLIGERRGRRRQSPVSVTPTEGPTSQD